jgi:Mn2+/Fe2+ NRAMP family transporter
MKLADLGPGLLLAATGIGVGDMVSSTIAGAEYGLTLLWALAVGVVIKFTITEGAARWQLDTRTTLMEGWRDSLPRIVPLLFFGYFVIWSYFVSSALVAASALVPAAVFPRVPLAVWGAVHAVAAFTMVYIGRYDRFLAVIKWFIGLKFGAVIGATLLIAFWSGANWSGFGAKSSFSTAYALSVIGGVGGTVTLLSYGYWMREAGWSGRERLSTARADLTVSFALVVVFCFSMTFLSTQINWTGHVLDEGPRLCLLLADRIGQEIGPLGRNVFLVGFWGTAFSSVLGVWHGVPFLFDDWIHGWRGEQPAGQQGRAYRSWAAYLTLASISALVIQRPVWLVFVYTLVGSLFFPFVISTLLWLNNSQRLTRESRYGVLANMVLIGALLVYLYLAARAAGV